VVFAGGGSWVEGVGDGGGADGEGVVVHGMVGSAVRDGPIVWA
jgi:hypothetical protein